MEIVLGTHALGLGGSETYVLTLAEQLARLGHGVTVCAVGVGDGAVVARERGIEVVELATYRDEHRDAIVAQDAGMALELARRHPNAPLLFVAHSEEFDGQLPPGVSGLVGAVVVFNDRVERRVRALASALRVVRMRQPIDVARFRPRSQPGDTAKRLLLFGNNLEGGRLDMVVDVADRAGIEVVRAGAKGDPTLRPELAIDEVDLVMGYGRCALEGMACGRPTYVYDHLGGDGWVTPESYPALERDGFGGRASADAIDGDRLLADLRRYDSAMGMLNRDLVVGAHRAEHHAQEIVELLRSLDPGTPSQGGALGELAGLVRAQWSARAWVDELESHIKTINGQLADERATSERALAEATRERAEADRARAERDALKRTLRYRVGTVLAWPLDAIRARRRR